MALEEEVLHVQIVFQHPTMAEMVAVDLVVEVAGMDLMLLTRLLCQPPVILFLVEDALCAVIHLTLLMCAPIVEVDVSMIHITRIEGILVLSSELFFLLCKLSNSKVVMSNILVCITITCTDSNMPVLSDVFCFSPRLWHKGVFSICLSKTKKNEESFSWILFLWSA